MSRLDPSIVGNLKTFQAPSQLESQGRVMQLSDMMQRRELQKQQIESNKALEDQRRQELSDKKTKADKLKKMQEAIGESGGDFLKAVPRLRAIDYDLTSEWMKEYDSHITSEATRRKTEFDNQASASAMIANGLDAIKTNPALAPMVIKGLVANGLFDEEEKDIIEQLAKYDPSNPEYVAFVDGLIAQNTDAKTKLEQKKAADDLAQQKEQNRLRGLEVAVSQDRLAFDKTKPPTSTKSNLSPDTMVVDGKPERVLVGVDPDDKETFQKVFLKGVDVTDKAGFYKAPPQVSTILDERRRLDIEDRKTTSPGQIVNKSTGRDADIPEAAYTKIVGYQDLLGSVGEVKRLLNLIGSTGAIKGWVLKDGVHWPVVQDNITADQAEAVAELQRLAASYVFQVSGKAVTDVERKTLAKTTPNLSFTNEGNKSVTDNFERFLNRGLKNYMDARGLTIKEAGTGDKGAGDGPSEALIKANMAANPGMTREQVIEELKK